MRGFYLKRTNNLTHNQMVSFLKEREELKKLSTKDNFELIQPIIQKIKEKTQPKYELFYFKEKLGNTKHAFLSLDEKRRRRAHYITLLRQSRALSRKNEEETKHILGFKYKKVGGLIVSPLKDIHRIHHPESTKEYKKPFNHSNFIGIELEMIADISLDQMRILICENKLSHKIRVMSDGSIRNDVKHPYTFELNILDTEIGIYDTLTRLEKLLNNPNYNFSSNDSCGCHIHLDMRNRNPQEYYEKLYDNMSLIHKAADPKRVNNSYCKPNKQRNMEKARGSSESERGGRYQTINPESYEKHKTLEVRAFEGTTDMSKVKGWVDLLLDIINDRKKDVVNV